MTTSWHDEPGVDPLPQRERPEEARRRLARELAYQSRDLVLALAQDRDRSLVRRERARSCSARSGPPASRRTAPTSGRRRRGPAPRSRRAPSATSRRGRVRGGRGRRRRRLPVVERAPHVDAAPGGRRAAQADRPGHRIERATELQRRRGQDAGPLAEHPVAHQHRHAHRSDVQHRSPRVAPNQSTSSSLRSRMRAALSFISSIAARAT